MFNDKTILVTGGTGSFGKQFCETLLKNYKPNKIIVYSRDELKQYEMQCSDFFSKFCGGKNDIMRFFIGDIRDKDRLGMAVKGVDYFVHAAALKQVMAAEYNPFEYIKTNIIGAQNIIEVTRNSDVRKVIALSTDKAAAPNNLYGATKLTSDKLFMTANNYCSWKETKYSVVRYGNVMGSRGSVIPYFLKKKSSGIIPITDKRMTRFSITLQQSIDFVIQCFEIMWGGELLVPKIPSYKILDLAEAIAPNAKIEIIGIRPGEKLHEELITMTDAINTIEFKDHYIILPNLEYISWDKNKYITESHSSPGNNCNEGFSYMSETNKHYLSIDEIRTMITEELDFNSL